MKKEQEEKAVSKLNDIITLAERRGFFFPSCEIYSDAPSGFIDYGPNGIALKNKLIGAWREFLLKKDNMIEIDGSQIMAKSVFTASGHLTSFTDPLVDCSKCKSMFRADKLIEEKTGKIIPEKLKNEEYDKLLEKNKITCQKCGSKLGKAKRWNMMFQVGIGPEQREAYLRPETCQSIFVDFSRLFSTMRIKLPIGIAQLGKSFRNEVSPRQSLLRSREFTQAEVEVFFNPKKTEIAKFKDIENCKLRIQEDEKISEMTAKDAVKKKVVSSQLIAYYLSLMQQFGEKVGIPKDRIRFRKLSDGEKAFYAKEAFDFEILTSLGWIELAACNNRGDYDLCGHAKTSCKNLEVMDDNEKVLPWVFKLSMGIDRLIYIAMDLAFEKEMVKDEERAVLKLPANIAPIHVAIFPLVNKDGLPEIAQKIHKELKESFDVFYDFSGSIGKMYRRQDEIGTPFCITVDYQSKDDKTVTLRERDSMKQKRVKIDELKEVIEKALR